MSTMVEQGLQAKAALVINGLSSTELVYLSGLPLDQVREALSPHARAAAGVIAAQLTAGEHAELQGILAREGNGTTSARMDDTTGFAVGLYEGDFGNKGRPQPGPTPNATGSSAISGPLFLLGLTLLGAVSNAYGHPAP